MKERSSTFEIYFRGRIFRYLRWDDGGEENKVCSMIFKFWLGQQVNVCVLY